MFDIGMSELLIIGIVALIVIGPKDLPKLFRTLGRFTARARALGREFTQAMNAAAEESGMKDAADSLRKAADPRKAGLDALDKAADRFESWSPTDMDEPATPETSAPPASARGGETAKLAAEREEAARKTREAGARKAEERLAREAAPDAAPPPEPGAEAQAAPAGEAAGTKA